MLLQIPLADEAATVELGRRLGACARAPLQIQLLGDLGAGKTTLTRGFLRARGHEGAVKSPTYTLVEPYDTAGGPVYHFDLYRLGSPEELEYMGLRDYFAPDAVCLVEWPSKGGALLPAADLVIELLYCGAARTAHLLAKSVAGQELLAKI